jgi:hypothetical protein
MPIRSVRWLAPLLNLAGVPTGVGDLSCRKPPAIQIDTANLLTHAKCEHILFDDEQDALPDDLVRLAIADLLKLCIAR